MRYRNTLTGAVLETNAKISGANWQEISPAGARPAQKETRKAEPVPEDPDDDDSDLEVGEVPVQPKKGRKK